MPDFADDDGSELEEDPDADVTLDDDDSAAVNTRMQVRRGETITYLYRCVHETQILYVDL